MAKRIYDTAKWKRLRALKLETEPLCWACGRRGLTVPATVVDHVVAIAAGGDPYPPLAGLNSLCAPCHNGKTLARDTPGLALDRERLAFKGCGVDGLPVDPHHPFWGRGGSKD